MTVRMLTKDYELFRKADLKDFNVIVPAGTLLDVDDPAHEDSPAVRARLANEDDLAGISGQLDFPLDFVVDLDDLA